MFLNKKIIRLFFQHKYRITVLMIFSTSALLIYSNNSLASFQSYSTQIVSNVKNISIEAWQEWIIRLSKTGSALGNETTLVENSRNQAVKTTSATVNVTNPSQSNESVAKSPKGIPDGPRFQKVNDYDAWLFSAFFDNFNNSDLIRVFGIQPLALKTKVFCHLTEGNTTYVIEGKKTNLYDWHQRRRRVFSYECLLNETSRPHNVSLTFNETDTPTNNLQVLYPSPIQRNFTVCYSSLYNYNNPYQLIQNVEFNRVLGAEHFFLYRESVSSAVDTVLRHYQKQDILTVIEWPIPVGEVHYHGQILIVNDCAYRNRGVSRYVAIQDTDELIIPHMYDNWSELLEVLNKEFELSNESLSKQLGTYSVQSSFYQHELDTSSLEWADVKRNYSVSDEDYQMFKKFSLSVFLHVKRLNMHFVGERQKSFIRPEMVLFNDIHTPDMYRPGIINVTVSVEMAVVHHYRGWSSPQNNVVDPTALKYKGRVLPLINETLSLLSF